MAASTVVSRLRIIDEDGNAVGIEEDSPLVMDSQRVREELAEIRLTLQEILQFLKRGF